MDEQVIVVQCLKISNNGSPMCWFQVMSLSTKTFVSKEWPSFFEAESWAMQLQASLADDWNSNEVAVLEDAVAASTDTDLIVVVATAWIRNRIAPDRLQPKCRYWILDRRNRVIAMKASLKEALAVITHAEHSADENADRPQRNPRGTGHRGGG